VMTRNLCDPTALRQLIRQGEETLVAMSGMLDTLLDINQLEAGVLRPAIMAFPLDRMLERMRNEFGYHTRSHGLGWRTVSCGLEVRSDPRLLEQIVRNLLSNAVKYTRTGRVLLGCRRRGDRLRIEVWDTGPGIPPAQCGAVFEEFYQADNPAHDLRRGAGLGLAIVEHLAGLLGHRIEIRSWEGRGSMFAVEVPRAPAGPPSGD
jgi:two-component system CheB/CheR fusion protein